MPLLGTAAAATECAAGRTKAAAAATAKVAGEPAGTSKLQAVTAEGSSKTAVAAAAAMEDDAVQQQDQTAVAPEKSAAQPKAVPAAEVVEAVVVPPAAAPAAAACTPAKPPPEPVATPEVLLRAAEAAGPDPAVPARARRRSYVHGKTPRCGACVMCLNPQRKKACTVNRERMEKGLPPILKGTE